MRYLLDIPELHADAFRPEAGRMRLYGKSDTPPTPDYAGAAKETAAGNLEAARYATASNRPKQITPYGTSTWTQGAPTRTFNQGRYDDAMSAYQKSQSTPQGGYFTYDNNDQPQWVSTGGSQMSAPDRNADQFYDMTPSSEWTQTVSLTPQAQATLDKQLALSNRYADLATTGLDKAYDTLSDPTLDTSQLPARAINPGQTAQQAIMARLQPSWDQKEEALRTRLANQGITDAGSEAYQNDFRNFNQGRNDAEMQAALYGIDLDQKNRSDALAEQAYLKDRPLNLINALRSGAQVQNPQFGNFAQQQTTAGPNLLDAVGQTYGANLDATNASNAQTGQTIGGLASIAAMVAF